MTGHAWPGEIYLSVSLYCASWDRHSLMALQDAMCVPDSCSNSHTSACVKGVSASQTTASTSAVPMERLSSAVVPHDKITAFVWSTIRHCVPAVSSSDTCDSILLFVTACV